MPPCIGTSIPRIVSSAFWLTTKPGLYRKWFHGSARQFKSLSDSKSSQSHGDILTAIHRTSLILPKILPQAKSSVWRNFLRASSDVLSGAAVRRRRIAVFGLDELCRPHELVSALLDDPLVSDRKIIQALRSRKTHPLNDLMTISHDGLEHPDAQLWLRLPWLKELDVDVVEIPSGHPDAIPLLYDADIQILVTSPLSSPLAVEFMSLLLKQGSFLILEYPTHDQAIVNYAVSQLTQRFPTTSDTLKSKMLQVYPPQALSALDIFREGSNSVDAIQTFQNDFLGSGVTALSQSITKALSSDNDTQRAQCASFILTGALEACRNAVQLGSDDIAAVQLVIDELHSQISHVQTISMQDILGGSDAPVVGDSVQRSTRGMQVVMDAIPWWKLPIKIDDLSGVLSHAAERVWCRDLYAKLEFQTGRLACLRSQLISDTLENLHLMPVSFHSAILVNQLHQLSTCPPELGPNSLTYPLSYRLQQLQEPILVLHRRAQRAMLTASAMTFGSAGGAYAAWLTGHITPATAVGLGAMGFVIALRWFVGRWEKGKTRWWEDWRRVGDGLERDIKDLLALILKEKVTSVPSKAAKDLENMVMLRSHEIDELNKELESVEGKCGSPLPEQSGSVN